MEFNKAFKLICVIIVTCMSQTVMTCHIITNNILLLTIFITLWFFLFVLSFVIMLHSLYHWCWINHIQIFTGLYDCQCYMLIHFLIYHLLVGLKEGSGSLTIQRSSKGSLAIASIGHNGENVVIENTTSGARAKVILMTKLCETFYCFAARTRF